MAKKPAERPRSHGHPALRQQREAEKKDVAGNLKAMRPAQPRDTSPEKTGFLVMSQPQTKCFTGGVGNLLQKHS